MSRLNPPTLREWQPGDGLTCSFAKAAPLELPCGKPVTTAVAFVTMVGAADRNVARPLCLHHAHGYRTGDAPSAVVAKAKKAASERLVHEHWEEFQRYLAEAVDSLVNQMGAES